MFISLCYCGLEVRSLKNSTLLCISSLFTRSDTKQVQPLWVYVKQAAALWRSSEETLHMSHRVRLPLCLVFIPRGLLYFVWSLIYFTYVSASELIRPFVQTPAAQCWFYMDIGGEFLLAWAIKDIARLDIISISKLPQRIYKRKPNVNKLDIWEETFDSNFHILFSKVAWQWKPGICLDLPTLGLVTFGPEVFISELTQSPQLLKVTAEILNAKK